METNNMSYIRVLERRVGLKFRGSARAQARSDRFMYYPISTVDATAAVAVFDLVAHRVYIIILFDERA